MLHARPMLETDLPAIMAIEEQAYPHPWSQGIFEDCLKVSAYECRVYEDEGELCAYTVVSSAAGEAHLLNICVRPGRQGQGLGREVLDQVIARTRENGADTLFLEVRVSNNSARRLYESAGFNEIGQRFDYYPADQGREDALVFALPLL
ncbi:ribosomal protein S18-alanine N-acetyltransferase [Thiolapillus brandeum]|uniref:[Ribosomal protein bS18]-alanine N-acetyltransferase n=1 Tax=Thiolapillus brandeum TaxID=1076588 RepID=A0A7U6JID1_9GAMM|nr:ribosomal protein S18-alanine N-acetyltransferase [Thiolapillus brandeum]BAO44737.1 ribosomal-protein-alanine N-acetyltransferase [Thiolapillus brandeum]